MGQCWLVGGRCVWDSAGLWEAVVCGTVLAFEEAGASHSAGLWEAGVCGTVLAFEEAVVWDSAGLWEAVVCGAVLACGRQVCVAQCWLVG